MLITADWIVPVTGEPIRNGAVLLSRGRIAELGPANELIARNPDARIHNYPGCTLMPGLVNAHTHLAMSCLKGLIPSQPFHEWLKHIPVAWNALSDDDIAASIAMGALRSIASGVVAVGDIAYGPESISIAADTGLGGVFFWEILGIELEGLPQALYDAEYPSDPLRGCQGRLRCGISPHASYTSGPRLLQGTHKIAMAQSAAFAVHVAESPAEVELLMRGQGPLTRLSDRLAAGFEAPGITPVRYLDRLGVLEQALAIHCTRVTPGDIGVLAAKAAGVALCPRSNAYLEGGSAPIRALADSGVALGLGTDSLASNSDLDLFEEARALQALEPSLSARRIIEIMTREGAAALGIAGRFGSIEPGRDADFAIFAVSGDDPHASLLANAGRSTIQAVMSAGVWRVLSSSPVMGVSRVERGSCI
ncbi:MAG: amidohydrolase family protein, partial [Coriobacteriia bacterium]|nr:amidohydrolase family protein [Coriobacteriia bacterium]